MDLYYVAESAPCRSVLLAAKVMKVNLNLILVDMEKGEHMTPAFLKLNPQHCVPTLVDKGFSLWESRAIIRYLHNQYAKKSGLYPEDPKARALVDQRLDFDIGILYNSFCAYYYPQIFFGLTKPETELVKIKSAFSLLDGFLNMYKFTAGNKMTIADFSLVTTISNYDALGFNMVPYANIMRWYFEMKKIPEYEETNGQNMLLFREFAIKLTKENKKLPSPKPGS